MTKAYSYQRFSNPSQLKGDSLRRQTELAQTYAADHGLELADLTFRDLGVSAFRGANATEGALAAFLKAVDSGAVAKGSYLLVESFDRLSRDRLMPALKRFTDLLERDITVVTLQDSKAYTAESLNDLTGLIVPLVYMSRANEESEAKSKRLKAVWSQKKADAKNGKLVTHVLPGWLTAKNGKVVPVPERVKVVKLIFDLASRGWGKQRIAQELNQRGIKPFGRGKLWSKMQVQATLKNRAVIGEYQPERHLDRKTRVPDGEPIKGYYPPVIENSLFFRVQTAPGKSGYKGEIQNLLSGITFCAKCGGRMGLTTKTSGTNGKHYRYLICNNKLQAKSCDMPMVPYPWVEETLVPYLAEMMLQPTGDGVDLVGKLEDLTGQIAEKEDAVARLLDLVEKTGSASAVERLTSLESSLTALKMAQSDVTAEIEGGASESSILADYETLLSQAETPEQIYEIKAAASQQIKRLVKRVVIIGRKDMQVEPIRGLKYRLTEV